MKKTWLPCLLILVLLTAGGFGCASAPPTGQPTSSPAASPAHAQVRVPWLTTTYGAGGYEVVAIFEQLVAKNHPWLRIIAQETAGYLYDTIVMGKEQTRWKTTIAYSDPVLVEMGIRGMEPFYTEAIPNLKDFRRLFSATASVTALITLNPDIKTVYDLDGKRIGVGLRSQSGYGEYPTRILEDAFPDVKVRIEHMDMSKWSDLLLNGQIDAIVALYGVDRDFKIVTPFGPTVQVLASGRKIYYIDVEASAFKRLQDKNIPFLSYVQVPTGALTGQTQPFGGWVIDNFVGAHQTFPEDIAYEVVKSVIQLQPEWANYHALAKPLTPATLVWGFTDENTHPGAKRAYEEAGIWKLH